MGKRILVIEDDEDISELIHYNFKNEGYEVCVVSEGDKANAEMTRSQPHVIILDIMLPGKSGLDILKEVRNSSKFKNIPIIMLTAKGEEFDIVLGLELGADDYITKPFSPKELLARTKAVLRRSEVKIDSKDETVNLENISIDKAQHTVAIGGKIVPFTLSEFKLLTALAEARGRVLTRDQLLEQIAGESTYVIDRNVDVHIRAVRKKLDGNSDLIETVRGVGYRCRV